MFDVWSVGFVQGLGPMCPEQSVLSPTLASTATLRLAKLHALDSFYTPLEERFERITRLARRALAVPVAAITVVEGQRQWFKSILGWNVSELPLSESFCRCVIETGEPFVVEDASAETEYENHPLVKGHPKFRFYAGYPLKDSEQHTVGTLCAYGYRRRSADRHLSQSLQDLSVLAERELYMVELTAAQALLARKLGESRRQAMFDPLTRLWNRRGATSLLNTALKDSVANKLSVGICVADIDNFKDINDQFGHQVGDQVLRRVARHIVSAVRPHDVVCRYGGEEFLVILRDVDESVCRDIGDRICRAIRNAPMHTKRGVISTSVSVGIAMRKVGDPISSTQLIETADRALYDSKRSGRDMASFAAG